MQSEQVAVKASNVKYTFILQGGSCSANIAVQSTPGNYTDPSSQKPFSGYAMVKGGTITFQAPGQPTPTTLQFIPHYPGGTDSQILWADNCGIPGGSKNGLSTSGPYFGGGMPSLSWVEGTRFNLNLGTELFTMRLNSCDGWPIPQQ